MKIVLAILAGYFAGAIPFAYLVGRLKGIDIRKQGSGNMGTTNAFRILGKKLGFLVFLGDFGKGMLASGIGMYVGGNDYGPWLAIVTGMLALVGHSWNPFFGFKATGKGAATGAGAALWLMPVPILITMICFGLGIYLSGYVSVGSMSGAGAAIISSILLQDEKAFMLFAVCGATIVIFRHRENIRRIRDGEEPKVSWRCKLFG